MNLMVLSPGRRCEVISYFKQELNKQKRRLIVADRERYAPALYFADKYYVVKKDSGDLKRYIADVMGICKKEKVGFLITLIDPELELLSRYRNDFKRCGIELILSHDTDIRVSFNKYLFYLKYKNKLNLLKTFGDYRQAIGGLDSGELKFPLVAKFKKGSAGFGMSRVISREELEFYKYKRGYIFQEYFRGKEIGVDLYFDLISGLIASVFMKEKFAMRAGETDKSISIFREDILTEVKKLENFGNYRGAVDVDVFVSCSGQIYINEINPRFGGGYPHAHYCGVNFIKLIVNNISGRVNKFKKINYPLNVVMMKSNKYVFKEGDKIYER